MANYPERDPLPWEKGIPPAKGTPEWDVLILHIQNEKGHAICGAQKKSNKWPCANFPVNANRKGRCRMHGGSTPAGIVSPHWKDGQRSRYALVGAFGEKLRARQEEIEYTTLRDELAIVKQLLEDELNALDQMKSNPLQPLPAKEFDEKERKAREKEIRQQQSAIKYSEGRVVELTDQVRKLAATETNRVKVSSDTISGQQIRSFGITVLEALRRRASAFGQVHGIPLADVLALVGDVQNDVVAAIRAARGANLVESGGGEAYEYQGLPSS